jgi:NADPH-dependent ferric siderophore reductase
MASIKKALTGALGRILFDDLHIVEVHDVAPHFKRLMLAGDALRSKAFTPGDKLQVLTEDGPRTYSPFAFDPAKGSLELLAFTHGDGPGARWVTAAAAGQKLRSFGPRRSLALPALGEAVLLFGDETSFGVARALRDLRGEKARFVFEVRDLEGSKRALESLQLATASLLVQRKSAAHLTEVAQHIRQALRNESSALVFTGSAQSIHALRTQLKVDPPPATQQKVKAYWSLGKRGLD